MACDDAGCRQILTDVLKDWNLEAITASTVSEALASLRQPDLALVFCENGLVDGGFADLLNAMAGRKPVLRLIALIHNEHDYSDAVRLGAFDVLPVSCHRSDVQWMMINALRNKNEFVRRPMAASSTWMTMRQTQGNSSALHPPTPRSPDANLPVSKKPGVKISSQS